MSMTFKKILMTIAPSFGKKSLLENLSVTRSIIKDASLPIASVAILTLDFKTGPEYKAIQDLFSRKVKRGKIEEITRDCLNNCLVVLDYLENEIEKKYEEDITRSTLKAFGLSAIRLLDCANILSVYSRAMLSYLMQESFGNNPTETMSKAEIYYLQEYKYQFLAACEIMIENPKSIIKKLESIPDVHVTADSYDATAATVGVNKIDPLKLNFISPRFNPAFFIGKQVARYQANKYKQAVADLHEIQCRILYLQQQAAGKQDPKLEKQIDYYSNLNTRLKAEIAQMEEDYELR